MKVSIIADVREIRNDGMAPVRCEVKQEKVRTKMVPVAFEAILKAMKDANKSAFYAAMMNFIDEKMSGDKEYD